LNPPKILILDYSITRFETASIKYWLPAEAQVTSLFIDTAASFPDDLAGKNFTHVIHSGSELSITKPAPFTAKVVAFIRDMRDRGVWQFGICYGHQLVSFALVGPHAVRTSPAGFEAGWNNVTFTDSAGRLLSVRETEAVWQHHFDEVTELPDGSELLATNPHSKIQAYLNYKHHVLGTQFHPEVDRETGNKFYLKDRKLLERHNYNVDEIVSRGPSFDTGRIFFDFFLQ
jgi:GMP synthase (glutamine-hydrolysing)